MKQKFTLLLSILFTATSAVTFGQTVLKMGTGGGPAGNGPVTTSQTVTLYQGGTTSISPATTVTYSLSNQQYAPGAVEGLSNNHGMSFGGNLTAAANSPIGASALYSLMNGIGNPTNNMFTSCSTATAGTGMNVATDRSISLFNCTDALINAATVNQKALNARVYYGDLTITFNTPVANPVLQIVGLGGTVNFTKSGKNYDMGFTTEFDLVSSNVSLSKLSGNTQLSVTSTQINNAATWLGSSSAGSALNGVNRYAASGSVLASGTNITSITLKVYVRGDGGRVSNGSAVVSPSEGVYPVWSVGATNPFGLSSPNVSGDMMLFGVSLQKPVALSGNVFNDANGGNVNNSTGSTNIVPAGMYANLADAAGKIVATAAVNTNGTYSFANVFTGSYTVNISTTSGVQGAAAPAVSLPAGWVNTGEFNGTPNTGTDASVNGTSAVFTVAATDITNINFGIERLPESVDQSYVIVPTPVGTFVTLNGTGTPGSPGPLKGSDPEDYAAGGSLSGKTAAITQLPVNTQLWYNNAQIKFGADGVTAPSVNNPFKIINYDPALLKIKILTAMAAGSSTSFKYAYIDAAGKMDASPATYVVGWAVILPVDNISLTTVLNDHTVVLNWFTFNESNTAYFEVERSFNNSNFIKTGITVTAAGNAALQTNYNGKDDISNLQYNGTLYYRVKLYDNNGSFKYSNTTAVAAKSAEVKVWPNPFVEKIQVTVTVKNAGQAVMRLSDISGRTIKMQQQQLIAGTNQISIAGLGELPKGMYILEVINPADNSRKNYTIAK
ncbi:T9SS type A sorting domain-containing protein [Ferruginibacter profundus]